METNGRGLEAENIAAKAWEEQHYRIRPMTWALSSIQLAGEQINYMLSKALDQEEEEPDVLNSSNVHERAVSPGFALYSRIVVYLTPKL